MVYEAVHIIPAGKSSWVVARGWPGRGYLTREYAGDIVAFKLSGLPKTIPEVFGTYGPPNIIFGGGKVQDN
jgi:hypothetical protein